MEASENPPTEKLPKRRGGLLFLKIAAAALTLPVIAVAYQLATWPDVAGLARTNPSSTAFIDRYLENAGEAGSLSWMWTDWEDISPTVKAAVLVSEDIEFFSHDGFSRSEIKAAIEQAIETGDLRGASTLTQQLAKNLWLTPSRNPFRKIKEAILTTQVEKHLPKKRIFELYLNVAEFGRGVYGVEAASRTYFARTANQLSRREGALLAASLPRPSTWNPTASSPGYAAKVGRIEDLMSRHQAFLERRVGLAFDPSRDATLETSTISSALDDGQLVSSQNRQ